MVISFRHLLIYVIHLSLSLSFPVRLSMNAVLQLPLSCVSNLGVEGSVCAPGKDTSSLYLLSGNLSSSVTVAVTWGHGDASVTQVDLLTARGQRPLPLSCLAQGQGRKTHTCQVTPT